MVIMGGELMIPCNGFAIAIQKGGLLIHIH